jgi:hypothetical protein
MFCEYKNKQWGNISLYLKVKWAAQVLSIVIDKKITVCGL